MFLADGLFSGSKGPKKQQGATCNKSPFQAPMSPPKNLIKNRKPKTKEMNFSKTFPSKRTRTTTTTMNTTTNARKGIITPSSWFTKYFATTSEKWKAKYTPAARI